MGKHRGYVERQEVTGADGGPQVHVRMNLSALTDEELDHLDRLVTKATNAE
jgi:hypothetical protein